jgi:large subunit ribosomal protein L9
MKVVLTQDVPKLGDSGTLQDVKDGYARNFLIPQGLAAMATPGMVKQVEERQRAEARRIAKLEEEMRDLADRIEASHIEIIARVGEQGRLYGSVTSTDIAEKLSEAVGEEIDRRKLGLDEPIRTVGDYEIPVRLVGKLAPMVKVRVYDPDAPELSSAIHEDDEGDEETANAGSPEEAEALQNDLAEDDDNEELEDPAVDADDADTDETG